MAALTHFTFDAFPRVIPAQGGLGVIAPFRVEGGAVVAARLVATVDGVPWTARARVRRVTREYVDGLRARQERKGMFDFTALPPYLEMANRMAEFAYVEGRLSGVREGARVTYALEATVQPPDGSGQVALQSAEYALYAVRPDFDASTIRRTFIPHPGDAPNAWVLMHRRANGFDHVRVDVLCLQPDPGDAHADHERVALQAQVGATTYALRSPDLTELPLVDISADAVVFSVPDVGGPLPEVSLTWNTGGKVTVDLDAPTDAGRARVMFINFAIQGLNDYFAGADTVYDPPRTYTQVTMRDEDATFSSRPGSRENGVGDGYAFTLAAHRHYKIPQLWAMNGGLIDLLAHDSPDDLAAMRDDVAAKLLEPVNTGFGAHRVPYYARGTNAASIRLGRTVWEATVAPPAPVYYPDSRIYVQKSDVMDALTEEGMRYVVVDAGTHEDGTLDRVTVVRDPQPAMGTLDNGGRWVNWQYLWRDATTGLKVLFIDPEMKEKLLGGPEPEADRGKVTFDLRRKFLELAAQPQMRRDNLLVYSDDADKASGNGWFDGNYSGSGSPMNKYYQAALSWLAIHPWVDVVTTADLEGETPVGTLELVRASDPYIATVNVAALPDHDYGLAFDTWYAKWADTAAAWLGETLRAVSDRAELAVAGCPVDNEMVEIARLALVMNLHESQWSKRARSDPANDPANYSEEAEDFVIAESVGLRAVHVWLHAGVWAEWAQAQARPQVFRDAGPVIGQVRAIEAEVDRTCGSPGWAGPDRGLQWDHDPLANVVLYSNEALVVIDRNGGRITHLFTIVGGRPVAVSGTFKANQFLDLDWSSGTGAECDGIVLQNTVCTPNHAYVACDVEASAGTYGESPRADAVFDWIYPDNFNLYDAEPDDQPSVTFTYGPASLAQAPDTLADLHRCLTEDREAKLAGQRGYVLHDVARFGAFTKTITLEGRTVRIAYAGTAPGHRVANEFCVDLHAAALRGVRQAGVVDHDRATVSNADGLAATVVLGSGCAFAGPPTHRVMTDTVEVVATGGGTFDYRIELP